MLIKKNGLVPAVSMIVVIGAAITLLNVQPMPAQNGEISRGPAEFTRSG